MKAKRNSNTDTFLEKLRREFAFLQPTAHREERDWLGRKPSNGPDWLGRRPKRGKDWLGRKRP